MCQCSYQCEFNSDKISLSTSKEISFEGKISQLILRFKSFFNENILSSMNFSLENVTKLHLYFNEKIPVYYVEYLGKTFDVSQLIEVKFEILPKNS